MKLPETAYLVVFFNQDTGEFMTILRTESEYEAQKFFEEASSQASNVRLLMVNDISDLIPARLVCSAR